SNPRTSPPVSWNLSVPAGLHRRGPRRRIESAGARPTVANYRAESGRGLLPETRLPACAGGVKEFSRTWTVLRDCSRSGNLCGVSTIRRGPEGIGQGNPTKGDRSHLSL